MCTGSTNTALTDIDMLTFFPLQACVPCHKAKRRCDGGLPCSNCDFSGRGCSYSDSQGNAVHPTARAHVRDAVATYTEPSQQRDSQPQQYHHSHQGSFSSTDSHDNFVRPRLFDSSSTLSVRTRPSLGGSEDGQAISEDHLTKFFKTAPFNAILPTAFQDVSRGGPTALLSMAISSFCLDRMAGPSPTRNEYATSIKQLASMAEDERQGSLCEKPSAELIVTTLLQAIHEASLGRMVKAVSVADAAVRLVHDLELDQGALSAADPRFEGAELARLVCLVFVTDVLICVIAGKTSCLHEEDFTLAIHRLTGQHQDAATVAFLALLRVTHIFVDVVAISKKEARGLWSSSQEAQQSRRACRIRVEEWKSSLYSSDEYNHSNLVAVSRGQGCQDAWAWAWSMMHAMAEVITGLLLAAGTPSDPTSSPKSDDGKKGSSHDSLVVLLDTLGQDHRRSVLSAVPLLVASLLPEQSSKDSHTKAKAWLHEARDGFLLSDDQLNKAAGCLGLASVSSPRSQSSGTTAGRRSSYPVPALKTSSLSPNSAAPRDGIFGSQASPVSPQDHRRHASLSISSVISSGSTSVYGGERLSPRPPTITTTATSKSPSSPPFRPGQQRHSSQNTLPPIQSMSNGGNGNNASLASNSGTLSASLVSTSVPTSPMSAASRSSASSSPVSSSTSLMMYKTSVA